AKGTGFNTVNPLNKGQFTGCEFTGLTCGLKGAFYATEVSGCTFSNMVQGIAIKQFVTKLGNNIIDNNIFNNIREGVYIQGGYLDALINNTFTGIYSDLKQDGYGVYVVSSGAFHIEKNSFDGLTSPNPLSGGATYGVVTENSGALGGIIFDNNFVNTDFGIQTQDNNENLVIRCNTFTNIGTYSLYVYDGQLKQQGVNCSPTNPPNRNENQAGNEWTSACIDNQDIFIGKGVHFDYYAHKLNIDNTPATVPECSQQWWKTMHLKVCDLKKTTTSCNSYLHGLPAPPPETPYEQYILEYLEQQITELKDENQLLENEKLRQQLKHEDIATAKNELETTILHPSKKAYAEELIVSEQITEGRAKIDEVLSESIDIAEDENFAELMNTLADLKEEGNTIHEMDEVKESKIRTVANSGKIISAKAQVSLELVKDEIYVHPIKKGEFGEKSLTVLPDKKQENESNAYFRIYPNPNNGNMEIEYYLPDNDDGKLTFYSIEGKIIAEYSLKSSNQRVFLNAGDIFSNGIYYYKLITGKTIIATDKLVIVK
ncbi:MAG: T9SS type A sorting domain-containing protein, partial [Bacteroidia bacterium]|nr:T9SS type A sorting domain-containing protein [Bacteroidia bacterium]